MTLPIVDIIGFLASILVFLTFCMRTLLPLRVAAIMSNLFFIAYGIMAGLLPILTLHLLLLPMNLWRTAQQLRTRRRMRAILVEEPNLSTLLPFMTNGEYPDGTVIFHRGDTADRFYVVAEGVVRVEEFDRTLRKGAIFGEIGFFAADGKRTATVRTEGPVKLTWIDRDSIMRACYDNPDFALFLTRLMVTRLVHNEEAMLEQT